jgi:hypothetical protein
VNATWTDTVVLGCTYWPFPVIAVKIPELVVSPVIAKVRPEVFVIATEVVAVLLSVVFGKVTDDGFAVIL